MKTKRKKDNQNARALHLLASIDNKLTFLCEAKDRDERHREEQTAKAKKFVRAIIAEGAKRGVFPPELAKAIKEVL